MSLFLPEDAPATTRRRLDECRAAAALGAAGTQFLVYDPRESETDVLLLHFPFEWDEGSQRVSAVCTSGLGEIRQDRGRRWCFESFELVFAFHSPGFSQPFLRQILHLCRDVRSWMGTPEHPAFGLGDWVRDCPLLEGTPSALLVPPAPELCQAGLRPHTELPSTLRIRDWLNPDALVAAGSFGFLQVVPLYADEYEHVAATRDGFRFFLDHLVASNAEMASGRDAAFKMLGLERKCAVLPPRRR